MARPNMVQNLGLFLDGYPPSSIYTVSQTSGPPTDGDNFVSA